MASKGRQRSLLVTLSLTGFATSFGAYIVAANLPAYARETGAGLIVIGGLIALYDVAEILIKPLGALLSRKLGEWAVLRLGLGVFALASGLYLALPPGWLVLVRLGQGAGAALFSIMSVTLLIRNFPARKGTALGVYGAFKNSGYVLAPTIGGVFVYFHGFSSIFALCLAVGLVVALLTFLVAPTAAAESAAATANSAKRRPAVDDLLDSLRNRRTLPIFLIMFFNMVFLAAFFGFMPVLLAARGLSPVRAGWVLALNAGVFLAIQPLVGKLSDGVGRKHLIGCGLTAATLALPALPFLPFPFYIPAGCLLGLALGCVSPLGEAFVGDVSSPEVLALNLGIAGSYREVGEMVGPLAMGFIGQTLGLPWAFVSVGVMGIGGLICLTFLRENRPPAIVESARLSC